MQTTPSFVPIPSNGHSGASHGPRAAHDSFPRQPSFDFGQPGPSRYADATVATSGLSAMMRGQHESPPSESPSSNPHSGFHPGSFGAHLSFSALALGAPQTGSSPYSSSMAMSISPPRWAPGSMGGFQSGSFVGSVGALGTSFGRQAEGRERELEAKYVKDFTCCGHQLSGLHELLEHYEEEHSGLAPDVRLAAINAAQTSSPAAAAKRPFGPSLGAMGHGDAPTTPGMMDIEMDEPTPSTSAVLLQQQGPVASLTVNLQPGATPPWSAAFRNMANANMQPPACVRPSVLSYAPPTPQSAQRQQQHQQKQKQLQQQPQQQQQQQQQQPSTPGPSAQAVAAQQIAATQQLGSSPTAEQIAQAKLIKKAQKRVEKQAKGEEEEDHNDPPGEKRFRCPIEGCGKVYKQANGLKYHLTRSINSGHGNVAAMGGLMALLDENKD